MPDPNANKKLYTREAFEDLRQAQARRMAADEQLLADALDVKIRAGEYYWVHQTTWLGEPCLQVPGDLFATQEILFRTRPRFIIECGVAWGGSTLFYSTLMQVLGGEKIIGIDIYMPDDLLERLNGWGPLSERLHLMRTSSTDPATVAEVREIVGDCRDVLVILDSHHTHDHVLAELRAWSGFVGKGHYLICGDTTIERQPPSVVRPRPWGKGNNPATALVEWQKENDRFAVDTDLEAKLLVTNNPGGYLRALHD